MGFVGWFAIAWVAISALAVWNAYIEYDATYED